MINKVPKELEIEGDEYIVRNCEKLLYDNKPASYAICRKCSLYDKQQADTGEDIWANNCRFTHLCMGNKNEWGVSLYFKKKSTK